jgi:hypothetical protein
VIEFVRESAQGVFKVAEALSASELSESHGEELIPARECSEATMTMITLNTALELMV